MSPTPHTLLSDDPTLLPLALHLLPLTATDYACRAAIMAHRAGLAVVVREAGAGGAGGGDGSEALRRVAGDARLRGQCAAVITQVSVWREGVGGWWGDGQCSYRCV